MMRKIPESVTDAAVITKLNELSQQIEQKMKSIKSLKDSSKLEELKKVSVEIDTLDQEWKKLAKI
jgi:hypothetical protein